MEIQSISSNQLRYSLSYSNFSGFSVQKAVSKQQPVSFKRKKLDHNAVVKLLYAKGIKSDFNNSNYIAKSIYKVVNVMEQLFGRNSLPSIIKVDKLSLGEYAAYKKNDSIIINKNYNCFKNPIGLSINGINDHSSELNKTWSNMPGILFPNLFTSKEVPLKYRFYPTKLPDLPDWSSSAHPACTYVHEFGHTAHFKHLVQRLGYNKACDYFWNYLCGTNIPDPVQRLVIKYKISSYAIEANDLSEFVAEKLSKDVCDALTYYKWKLKRIPDVKYENIFDRKWSSKYSCPESYIDYYMQKVWNGDIEGSKKVSNDIKKFLAKAEEEERQGKLLNGQKQTTLYSQKTPVVTYNKFVQKQVVAPLNNIFAKQQSVYNQQYNHHIKAESLNDKIKKSITSIFDNISESFSNLDFSRRYSYKQNSESLYVKAVRNLENFKDSILDFFYDISFPQKIADSLLDMKDKLEDKIYQIRHRKEDKEKELIYNYFKQLRDAIQEKYESSPSSYVKESEKKESNNILSDINSKIFNTITKVRNNTGQSKYNEKERFSDKLLNLLE